jgi:6-phosphofructokinase 1
VQTDSTTAPPAETSRKAIAVLTSGGDASGMNMAIRAVTRCALDHGWQVFGVREGFAGMVADPSEGKIQKLDARDVGGILGLGGTILGTARCKDFQDPSVRARGIANLAALGVDALVVIGGNGSQTGAHALHEQGLAVVGIASTIDNDLVGSDITLGADTALNVAVDAVDKLRVTASSHRRASIVEVMGRDSGYIGLSVGVATGAEAVVLPEVDISPDDVAARIASAYERGKHHAVIIVAEGARYNGQELAAILERDHREEIHFEMRVTVLGHIQRGGTPTVFDRLLGARFGAHAVDCLAHGEHGVLVGIRGTDVVTTPLAQIVGRLKPIDLRLVDLAQMLAQ